MKQYFISKKNYNGEVVFVNYDKVNGYKVNPKNNFPYEGIKVNEMIIINIKDGSITAVVAINAPVIPAVANPAKVATFTPTGPGVIEDTAIMSVSCFVVYHFCTSAI